MNAEIQIAGVRMRIAFRMPETLRYFESFVTVSNCDSWEIRVDDEDIKRFPLICPSGRLDPFSEAYLLMPRVSAYLLQYQRVLIHGVAFVWHDHAWLITAPSGTGKTTQLRLWQDIAGDELSLINGDKTVLAMDDNCRFWLYPCPWMGKEKDFGTASGELAGIVVLKQSEENTIQLLSPQDSVLQIFQQFLIADSNKDELEKIGQMESALLNSVPIWLLKNSGDRQSAYLTMQTLENYEAMRNEKV